jgi:hypothetical protein
MTGTSSGGNSGSITVATGVSAGGHGGNIELSVGSGGRQR